ncbi:hypothetical protein [Gluconacetobacter entanii]|uniref:hypothetical protein n=1 Tax=Gluconacetobacter entanii TaxID=108528 RepID=UPI00389A0956
MPDFATEDLSGLTGAMGIIVSPGRHEYQFHYKLPDEVRAAAISESLATVFMFRAVPCFSQGMRSLVAAIPSG